MALPSIKRTLNEAKEHFQKGDFIKSLDLANQVVKQDPDNIPALLQLARSLKNTGNINLAIKTYNELIKKDRSVMDAYLELSSIYYNTKNYEPAMVVLIAASKVDDSNFDVLFRLGLIYKVMRFNIQAIEMFIKAHNIQPNNPKVVQEICDLMYITHSADEAKKYYKKLYELDKLDGRLINQKTLCPTFFESAEQLDKWRSQYEKDLDELLNMDLELKKPLRESYQSSFQLIYQNRPNKELNVKYAKLMRKVYKPLSFVAPHIVNYKKEPGKKTRIGFILRYDATHVIADCFFLLFKKLLENDKFEALIFCTSQLEPKDELWNEYKSRGQAFFMPYDVIESQKIIADQKPDIIIHPELGINNLAYFLAFARLAPVQCSFAGIPITSGLDTIDYYISNKYLEADNVQEDFTEKVILMENGSDFPDLKPLPTKFKTRSELNLPENKEIYMVPLKLRKFHPDFDKVIQKILERDINGVVILFEDYQFITDSLKARLKKNIKPEVFERIIFHPTASPVDFISYLKAANCLLDSFYFGAGSTGYTAFRLGAPIATMKKGFLCGGRTAVGFYEKIGLNSLIANSADEYVELCFRLANDREFFKECQKKILDNQNSLIGREETFTEFLDVMSGLLDKAQS